MAASQKLVIEFTNSSGGSYLASFPYADPEVTTSKVKALINKFVEHGSIFKFVPTAAKSAKLVVSTETELEIA